MAWFVASVCCVILGVGVVRFWRVWMRPWKDVEQLVEEVTRGRAPRTFLVDGNRAAQRIGIALEDMAIRHQELAKRAGQTELNIRAILGAMRDGLAVIDGDGRVRLWNRAVRELFAIEEDRLGASVLETFRDPSVVETVARTLRNGEIATQRIKLREKSSRGDRQIDLTSLPMPKEEGAAPGAVALFQDITHLQQLEQMRREFVSNVSHELRTPLSIFCGYVETLLDEPELTRAHSPRDGEACDAFALAG